MGVSIGLYLLGLALGLAIMRDPWPTRLITAALWPLGPAAFVLVFVTLVLAAAYLWPLPILGAVALAGALVWFAM